MKLLLAPQKKTKQMKTCPIKTTPLKVTSLQMFNTTACQKLAKPLKRKSAFVLTETVPGLTA